MRRVLAAAAALVLTGGMLSVSLPAEAKKPPKASATVISVPATVRPILTKEFGPTMGAADLKVRYKCVNDKSTAYFIGASVSQPQTATYSAGARNAPGGLILATCTGKNVTQTVRVYAPQWTDQTYPYLRKGTAELRVELMSRAVGTPGYYGYPGTGPSSLVRHQVKVTATNVT